MTDETETLMARAKQLEEENALLRSVQSPTGGEAPLRAENAMLRQELRLTRDAAQAVGPHATDAEQPATLEEFRALSPSQRRAVAQQMTRQERDRLLGRSVADAQDNYL